MENDKQIKYIIIDMPTESMSDILPFYSMMESMLNSYIAHDRLLSDSKGRVTPHRIDFYNEHMGFVGLVESKHDGATSFCPQHIRKGHFNHSLLQSCEFYSSPDGKDVEYVVVLTDIAHRDIMLTASGANTVSIADSIDRCAKDATEIINKEYLNFEFINWVAINTFNLLYIYDVIRDTIRNEETKVGIRKPDVDENNNKPLLS